VGKLPSTDVGSSVIDVIRLGLKVEWYVFAILGNKDRTILERVANSQFVEYVWIPIRQIRQNDPRPIEILDDPFNQISSCCCRAPTTVTCCFDGGLDHLIEDLSPFWFGTASRH